MFTKLGTLLCIESVSYTHLDVYKRQMLDNIPYFSYILSAFIGIGLAAASGFRVFLPMFAVSLASYMGWIPMNENFQWLAGLPTLITTGIATIVEILAYYIPYVDHLLDTLSVPLATVAGSVMSVSYTHLDVYKRQVYFCFSIFYAHFE